MQSVRIMSAVFLTVFASAPLWAQETEEAEVVVLEEVYGPNYVGPDCEGNACDAYVPVIKHKPAHKDVTGEKRLNSTLGGLAGAIIGEEIAGLPGAIAFGALGAATGYHEANTERWEEQAKEREEAWKHGGDTFYDPSRRFPIEAHWMRAGPSIDTVTKKK